MSKSDNKFINVSEDHELNGWLRKNNYRQTEGNRNTLTSIIKKAKGHYGASNLKQEELKEYHSENKGSFKKLEQI